MLKKLGWRPPAGSARTAIAVTALAVVILIIATYGNASVIRQDDGKAPAKAGSPTGAPDSK